MPSPRALRAGRAVIELSLLTGPVEKQLRQLQRRMQHLGSIFARVGVLGGAASGAILTPLAGAAVQFAAVGDEVHKMSARTGVAASELSALGFAAEQNGANLEQLEKGFAGLSRTFFDAKRGSAEAVDALDEIGLSFEQLNGLTPGQQFVEIASGLERISDESIRGAVAQKIFGRAGRQLLPMLKGAKGGIASLVAEAHDLGIVLSNEDAQSAADLTDALNRVWRQVKMLTTRVGAAMAGELTQLLNWSTGMARALIDVVKTNANVIPMVAKLAAVAGAAGGAFVVVGGALAMTGLAAGGVASLLGIVSSAFAAVVSPVGLVAAGVAALGTWFFKATEAGRQMANRIAGYFSLLATIAHDTIDGISNALAAGQLGLAGDVVMAGLRLAWIRGTASMSQTWLQFKDLFLRTTTEMVFDAQALFIKLLAHIKNVWTQASATVQANWAKAQAGVTTGVLELQKIITEKLTGETFDISVELQVNRDQLKGKLSAIQQARSTALANNEGARQQAMDAVEGGRRAAEQDRNRAFNAAEEAAANAKAAAEKQLHAAREAAQAARDAAEGDRKKKADGLLSAIHLGLPTAAETVMAPQAMFDTRLSRQMLGGPQDDILEETRRMRKTLDRIERDGGGIPVG